MMIDYIKELVQPVDPELAEAIFLEKKSPEQQN